MVFVEDEEDEVAGPPMNPKSWVASVAEVKALLHTCLSTDRMPWMDPVCYILET